MNIENIDHDFADNEKICLTLNKSVATAVTASPRVCAVAAMFGLGIDETRQIQLIPPLTVELRPGMTGLITGPSGSGKSMLLREIQHALNNRSDCRVIDFAALAQLANRPLVELLGSSAETACRLLARAGLGDAFVMMRRPEELSDGQRYRLRLAVAMALVEGEPVQWASSASSDEMLPGCGDGGGRWVVLADEFGALLDRATAQVISRSVRRWAARTGACFLAATTHDDLLEAIDPDLLIEQQLGGTIRLHTRPTAGGRTTLPPILTDLRIETGERADYEQLREFHYRSGSPVGITRILRIVTPRVSLAKRWARHHGLASASDSREQALVGVLVETLPPLSCLLREKALPRYAGWRDRGVSARLLNREIRCLARVIIHPQYRGLGLASRLVRHAIETAPPAVRVVEALAAMGHVHPFFTRAGMVKYTRPRHRRDQRLVDVLRFAGFDPSILARPRWVADWLSTPQPADEARRLLLRELRRWAGGEAGLPAMLEKARDRLLSDPAYFVAVRPAPSK